MVLKRSNPIEDPPAASSSEEEEEEETSEEEEDQKEGSSSEEEEEEEDPKTQTTPLTQKSPPPKKPETAALAIAVDESEESGSDSESESDTSTPNVKPISTKPMEETSNVKKPRSKALASSAKRPSESEEQEPKEAKRPKKKVGEEGTAAAVVVEEVKKTGEDAKKQLFQRLFSEEDEIAVLKGMLDYSAKKGSDPIADMNAFYDFVKKSIHIDVTKAQLMDKIRRLRKKFENNAGKGKKGEDRTFSKPHEQKAFELSKMIWGKEGISGKVESSARSNGKAKGNSKTLAALKAELPSSPKKKVECEEPMEVDKKSCRSLSSLFDKRFGVGGLEEEVLKNGLDMVEEEKRAALEEKWRKLQIAELELFLQRSELIKEHAKLMLEFFKSEDK